MPTSLQIAGIGKYLPERRVASEDLEAQMGLEPGWILRTSGVAYRHYVSPHETNSLMGARALERALDQAGLAFEDLDLLLNASGSYEMPIPETACLIQKALGKGDSGIPCFTIDATCVSFVTAFDVATSLISSGRYRTIAIVSSEVASRSLNRAEWESATLLGDGAAAVILRPTPAGEPSAVLSAAMETYGDGALLTSVKGGGNALHPLHDPIAPEDYTFHMDGPAVLQTAFRKLPTFLPKLFEPTGFTMPEIDLLIPHQASKIALQRARRLFRLREDQIMSHLETHGNCIAASIPMALHDAIAEGRIQRGSRVCLLGTAAGLSIGGLVFIY
jgi:3-oxoacyl-[acyl-carrier-protein] synthase-3